MYKTLMVPEFEQLLKQSNLAILDVREQDEFQMGHIKGAKNIPLSEFPEAVTELNKEEEYYIICHSGSRSQMACQYLAQDGYDVTNIMGGMSTLKGEVIREM